MRQNVAADRPSPTIFVLFFERLRFSGERTLEPSYHIVGLADHNALYLRFLFLIVGPCACAASSRVRIEKPFDYVW